MLQKILLTRFQLVMSNYAQRPGYALYGRSSMSDIIHSYDKANEILGKRNSRRLANNTYLERTLSPDMICVRLHATQIIKYLNNSDQDIILDSGGWQTVTTKQRLNQFSPAQIYSKKGIWYIYHEDNRYPFHDGITIDCHGKPVNVQSDNGSDAKLKRQLDRMVRHYIDGYCTHLITEVNTHGVIPQPSNGDCWGCLMKPVEKGSVAHDQAMGFDHFLSHFEDRYYVPSLLWDAIANRGNPGVCWSLIESDAKRCDTRMARESLQSYFKRLKPNIFAEYKRGLNVTR